VLLDKVLVGELGFIDRLAIVAISYNEVGSLAHEPWDHVVEAQSLVVEKLADAIARG
jgi:hypothetical protein